MKMNFKTLTKYKNENYSIVIINGIVKYVIDVKRWQLFEEGTASRDRGGEKLVFKVIIYEMNSHRNFIKNG